MMIIGITAGGRESGDSPVGKNKVPRAVKEAAMKGLRLSYRNNYGAWNFIGIARAIELALMPAVSDTTTSRMHNYLFRHAKDKAGKNFGNDATPSRGYMAWLNWGGDPAVQWLGVPVTKNPFEFSPSPSGRNEVGMFGFGRKKERLPYESATGIYTYAAELLDGARSRTLKGMNMVIGDVEDNISMHGGHYTETLVTGKERKWSVEASNMLIDTLYYLRDKRFTQLTPSKASRSNPHRPPEWSYKVVQMPETKYVGKHWRLEILHRGFKVESYKTSSRRDAEEMGSTILSYKKSPRRRNGSIAPFAVAGLALATGAFLYHQQGFGGGTVAGWKRERIPASKRTKGGYRYTRDINGVQYEIEDDKTSDRINLIALEIKGHSEALHPSGSDWGSWPSIEEAAQYAVEDAAWRAKWPIPEKAADTPTWKRLKADKGTSEYTRVINGYLYVITQEKDGKYSRITLEGGPRSHRIHPPYNPDYGSWDSLDEAKEAAEKDARKWSSR